MGFRLAFADKYDSKKEICLVFFFSINKTLTEEDTIVLLSFYG